MIIDDIQMNILSSCAALCVAILSWIGRTLRRLEIAMVERAVKEKELIEDSKLHNIQLIDHEKRITTIEVIGRRGL